MILHSGTRAHTHKRMRTRAHSHSLTQRLRLGKKKKTNVASGTPPPARQPHAPCWRAPQSHRQAGLAILCRKDETTPTRQACRWWTPQRGLTVLKMVSIVARIGCRWWGWQRLGHADSGSGSSLASGFARRPNRGKLDPSRNGGAGGCL